MSKRVACAEEIRDGKMERRTAGGGMLVGGSEGALVGSARAATFIVDFGKAGMMEVGGAALGATLSKSSHASSSCGACFGASRDFIEVLWDPLWEEAHCADVSSRPRRSIPRVATFDFGKADLVSTGLGGSVLPPSNVPHSSSSSAGLSLRLSKSNSTSADFAGA